MIDRSTKLKVFFRIGVLSLLLFLATNYTFAQVVTTFAGTIKDASTQEPLPYVVVAFDGTTIAAYSSESGKFSISNRRNITQVTISMLGYKTQTFTVPAEKTTIKEIYLETSDTQLAEVIIKPKKEKYSKKENPAVELIQKVIANKHKNNVKTQDFYQYKEYERFIFAFNEFDPNAGPFKNYHFLENYIDHSIIDDKQILPFSVKEKVTDVFYRNTPKVEKRIVKGQKAEGVDQAIEQQNIEAFINEAFREVDIYQNYITMLLNNFVSPLSDNQAVSFYKWYMGDTIQSGMDKYVRLDFTPFNNRDIGFTGNLYIALDSTYAVKKAVLRAPRNLNVNWVSDMVTHIDYEKDHNGVWIPQETRTAMDMTFYDALKVYVDKTVTYEDFVTNIPMGLVYNLPDPELYEKDYKKRPPEFWEEHRPQTHQTDHRMAEMMHEMKDVFLIKVIMNLGNILVSGYVPIDKDPDVNKVEIGTLPTFYSYNKTEGNRFRLTGATTKNFHPNLFLYGYGAYGTKDNKFKYMGEVGWSFRKIKDTKEEFPINSITFSYRNDINALGQKFTQAERDNIFMSLSSNNKTKMTYGKQMTLKYHREYHSGFSFKLEAQTNDNSPARNLIFEKHDAAGNIQTFENVKTTEGTLTLRYAHNERFYQQRRRRIPIPTERFIVELSNTLAVKGFLGGQYKFNKTSLYVDKDFWVTPYGKLNLNAKAEKLWGRAHFSSLITPNANTSYTLQNASFYLISPLEFLHDEQVSWEVNYKMGGWLFNKIPLLNVLKWREVFAFRGLYGGLSDKNNPNINRDQMILPENTLQTKGKPYMEYSLGVENIFNLFRIDYVRRVNYLDNPGAPNKHGVRFSFVMEF